jgi:hypothetical protein
MMACRVARANENKLRAASWNRGSDAEAECLATEAELGAPGEHLANISTGNAG